MTDERCDRTDLLTGQCACPDHRGGRSPEEEAAAGVSLPNDGLWFAARFSGVCGGCGDFFPAGANIHRVPPEYGTGYVSECCAEDVA